MTTCGIVLNMVQGNLSCLCSWGKESSPCFLCFSLGTAPTCGNVGASSSFIKEVTGKGGCTDDEKARSQGSHYPQKQQDCPEATVNWKPKTKEDKHISFGCSRMSHKEFVPHYSNFIQGLLGSTQGWSWAGILSRKPESTPPIFTHLSNASCQAFVPLKFWMCHRSSVLWPGYPFGKWGYLTICLSDHKSVIHSCYPRTTGNTSPWQVNTTSSPH